MFNNLIGATSICLKKNRMIGNADTTIRAIDDTYIYIYTPDDEIVEMLKSKFSYEFVQRDYLQELDYPD